MGQLLLPGNPPIEISLRRSARARRISLRVTLVAARDLAQRLIRVNTIEPGVEDKPWLSIMPEQVKKGLAS